MARRERRHHRHLFRRADVDKRMPVAVTDLPAPLEEAIEEKLMEAGYSPRYMFVRVWPLRVKREDKDGREHYAYGFVAYKDNGRELVPVKRGVIWVPFRW